MHNKFGLLNYSLSLLCFEIRFLDCVSSKKCSFSYVCKIFLKIILFNAGGFSNQM